MSVFLEKNWKSLRYPTVRVQNIFEFQHMFTLIFKNKINVIIQSSNDNPNGLAYNIKRKAQISVPASKLFADRPFPTEFSLLTTIKVKKRTASRKPMHLFSLLHKGCE